MEVSLSHGSTGDLEFLHAHLDKNISNPKHVSPVVVQEGKSPMKRKASSSTRFLVIQGPSGL